MINNLIKDLRILRLHRFRRKTSVLTVIILEMREGKKELITTIKFLKEIKMIYNL